MKKTVLYIQHASALGGSAMSLLYTIQGLREYAGEDYKIIVALAKWNEPMAEFYQNQGFEVVKPAWIDTYEHTTALHYNLLNPINWFYEIQQQINILKAQKSTTLLLEDIKPDIVHLNSSVLIGSAMAAKLKNIFLVWHIREHPVDGLFSMRKKNLINSFKKYANKVIFICKADMESWGNPKNGQVIYNFVDLRKFDSQLEKRDDSIKVNFNFKILYLGGVSKVKGSIILLEALSKLVNKYPSSRIGLIFPGSLYEKPSYLFYKIASFLLPIFGLGTYTQQIEKFIKKNILEKNILRLPYQKNIEQLFSDSDVLVFPSIKPHFARPIIEAQVMKVPVVGSKLGGVIELIEDGVNGLLCIPNNSDSLYERLENLLLNPKLRKEISENGYELAKSRYNQYLGIQQIIKIYESSTRL
jgi:glycosyltransferase involved in cell wall biosynthesis